MKLLSATQELKVDILSIVVTRVYHDCKTLCIYVERKTVSYASLYHSVVQVSGFHVNGHSLVFNLLPTG